MKTLGKLMIFESLPEIVDPEHTALVVWDCQNALVDHIFNRVEYLTNLTTLLKAARQQKIPVAYTKITPTPPGYQSAWNIYQAMQRFHVDAPEKVPVMMKPGSAEAEINDMIAPLEEDLVINKYSANIFFDTNFEHWMRFRGVQTILFTGIATEIGIEHSARDASIRGFYPVVVSDCVSSSDQTAHEMALKIISRLCLVRSSSEILRAWTA